MKPSDVGCCVCSQPSIVVVNGTGGCAAHIEEAMRPLGEAVRAARAAASRTIVAPLRLAPDRETESPLGRT
jgi:hypothetical protein